MSENITRIVLKSGKPSWKATVDVGIDPKTGTRKRISKCFSTKKDAQNFRNKVLSGVYTAIPTAKSISSLSSWMQTWIEEYNENVSETTLRGYKQKIRQYIDPSFQYVSVAAIDQLMIQRWVNDLAKFISPKTIKEAYGCLNRALEKAVELDYIPKNPAFGVKLPKQVHKKINCFDSAEAKKILQMADGTNVALIVYLGIAAGLRRGEIAGLLWSDIDFAKGIISVCHNRVIGDGKVITKTPKSASGNRDIPIASGFVKKLIKEHEKYLNDAKAPGFKDLGYVVHKEDGTPFHPDTITSRWEVFAGLVGCENIRLHDLRHTFATVSIENGTNIKSLQAAMGHSDYRVTANTYAHVTKAMNSSVADNIEKALF